MKRFKWLIIVLGFLDLCGVAISSYHVYASNQYALVNIRGNITYNARSVAIEDVEYANLEEAFKHVKDGDVVNVYSDQELSASIVIDKQITVSTIKNISCQTGCVFEVTQTGKLILTSSNQSISLTSGETAPITNLGTVVLENVNIITESTYFLIGGKVELKNSSSQKTLQCEDVTIISDTSVEKIEYSKTFEVQENATLTTHNIVQTSSQCEVPKIFGTLSTMTNLTLYSQKTTGDTVVICNNNAEQVLSKLQCDQQLQVSNGNIVVGGQQDQTTLTYTNDMGDFTYSSWQEFYTACDQEGELFNEDISISTDISTITLSGTFVFDQTLIVQTDGFQISILLSGDTTFTSTDIQNIFEFEGYYACSLDIQLNNYTLKVNGTTISTIDDLQTCIKYSSSKLSITIG